MIRFDVNWLSPPEDDCAFGPERLTWCELRIRVNDLVVTANHPADAWSRTDKEYVIGGASGLAEWIVECWPYLLWETASPFPKHSNASEPSESRTYIPSLSDVGRGWVSLAAYEVSSAAMGRWQHRHTLGHGSSDVSLPSLVFLPEDREVGIFVDAAPSSLDPSVRFTAPTPNGAWPLSSVWLPREDVAQGLGDFVEQTIRHAAASAEGVRWGEWLSKQWKEQQGLVADGASRRRLTVGDFLASQWDLLRREYGEQWPTIESLLWDLPILSRKEQLASLVESLPDDPYTRSGPVQAWKSLRRALPHGRPYEQGYTMANRVREYLKCPNEPLSDLHDVLDRLGVAVGGVAANGLFRSMALVNSSGKAMVTHATDDSRYNGVPPVRFAIAAALGRLICDVFPEDRPGASVGVAHGPWARWQQTQRANAFAAEFLLPQRAMSGGDVDNLAETYGISRRAADWHRRNRAHAA